MLDNGEPNYYPTLPSLPGLSNVSNNSQFPIHGLPSVQSQSPPPAHQLAVCILVSHQGKKKQMNLTAFLFLEPGIRWPVQRPVNQPTYSFASPQSPTAGVQRHNTNLDKPAADWSL